MTKTKKHYAGCYRVSLGRSIFGQITRQGREWHAEIRKTKSGDLIQYAGIWDSMKDAAEECERIILRESAAA